LAPPIIPISSPAVFVLCIACSSDHKPRGDADNRGDYQAQHQRGQGLRKRLHRWMVMVNRGDHNPSGYLCENIFETISGRDDCFSEGAVPPSEPADHVISTTVVDISVHKPRKKRSHPNI
jgi:hypothetical protein